MHNYININENINHMFYKFCRIFFYSIIFYKLKIFTINNARATWNNVSSPCKRNTSKIWKTRYNGNLAVNRVKNHCAANICVSTPRSQKCLYNSGS